MQNIPHKEKEKKKEDLTEMWMNKWALIMGPKPRS
jgi:hypothetical protein